MAKVEGKETEALRDITSGGIATELESRMRELEKNIAVAKEFIKLADESYSQVRHEWNLLQQDIGSKTSQIDLAAFSLVPEKASKRRRGRKSSGPREKTAESADENETKDSHTLTRIDSDLHRSKVEVSAKDSDSSEAPDSPSPHRQLKRLRPRLKG